MHIGNSAPFRDERADCNAVPAAEERKMMDEP